MEVQMTHSNVHFDTLYCIYSREYINGIDLFPILKFYEEREDFEMCHVIKTVLDDYKAIELRSEIAKLKLK